MKKLKLILSHIWCHLAHEHVTRCLSINNTTGKLERTCYICLTCGENYGECGQQHAPIH